MRMGEMTSLPLTMIAPRREERTHRCGGTNERGDEEMDTALGVVTAMTLRS